MQFYLINRNYKQTNMLKTVRQTKHAANNTCMLEYLKNVHKLIKNCKKKKITYCN